MTLRTSPWPAGIPCWADLSAPDVAAAKDFYAAVLGWTWAPTEEEFGGYAIAQVGEAAAAGVGPAPSGAPVAWTLYFATDDADTTAAAVVSHGGSVLIEPGDVGPLGRMAIAADPTGAVFGLWQAGTHIGAGVVNEPGGLTWEDLRSSDPDAAQSFYSGLFGFSTTPMEMAGPDYRLFSLAGQEDAPLGGIGGMMGIEGIPAHWVVYFGVADTRAAVAAAVEHGGAALMDPMETPYGLMAAIADPAGASFWVVQVDPQAPQPDREG